MLYIFQNKHKPLQQWISFCINHAEYCLCSVGFTKHALVNRENPLWILMFRIKWFHELLLWRQNIFFQFDHIVKVLHLMQFKTMKYFPLKKCSYLSKYWCKSIAIPYHKFLQLHKNVPIIRGSINQALNFPFMCFPLIYMIPDGVEVHLRKCGVWMPCEKKGFLLIIANVSLLISLTGHWHNVHHSLSFWRSNHCPQCPRSEVMWFHLSFSLSV